MTTHVSEDIISLLMITIASLLGVPITKGRKYNLFIKSRPDSHIQEWKVSLLNFYILLKVIEYLNIAVKLNF